MRWARHKHVNWALPIATTMIQGTGYPLALTRVTARMRNRIHGDAGRHQ